MKILTQIGIVLGICFLGEIISSVLPFTFPSSVISMIILFIFLITKILKTEHIKEKSDFLLKNMAFFFIPAGVGIMSNFEFIKNSIFQILIICLITTVLTFASTAFTVKAVLKFQEKRRGNL